MITFRVRTDLALEARESVGDIHKQIHGVKVEEYVNKESEVYVTKVIIESKNGAKSLGKPIGEYITIEAPAMAEHDEDYHREISEEIAVHLREIIPHMEKELSVLIVGLGNQDITADALGPNVIDNLCVTRHIVKEYGKAAYNRNKMHMVSAIIPGVMAKTGMETAEIVKGVVDETHPDVIIVIDALAARNMKRLNRTIQITNTGIHPGSGVGNHRNAITEESLGIPVIAIGVPTVIDAATIVSDAIEHMRQENGVQLLGYNEDGESSIMPELNNMYVTSKDIDETVKRLGFTISEALNITFYNEENAAG